MSWRQRILLAVLSTIALTAMLYEGWTLFSAEVASPDREARYHGRLMAIASTGSKGDRFTPSSLSPWLPNQSTVDLKDFPLLRAQRLYSRGAQDDITVIFPVTMDSMNDMNSTLRSIISVSSSMLSEVIVACQSSIAARTEREIQKATASHPVVVPITVLTWSLLDDSSSGILHILPSVLTPRALLLDVTALCHVDESMRKILLNSTPSNIPVGPRGLLISASNVSCIHSLDRTVPAAYLVPPFLAPTQLLIEAENGVRRDIDRWAALGDRIVRITRAGFGGLVLQSPNQSHAWCTKSLIAEFVFASKFLPQFYHALEAGGGDRLSAHPRLNILLPGRYELEIFGPTMCEMVRRGYTLRTMLFSWTGPNPTSHFALERGCHLHFEAIPHDVGNRAFMERLKTWRLTADFDVLMFSSEDWAQTMLIEASIAEFRRSEGTIVRIPATDLPFSEWMAVLGVAEWKNWHKPRIDLSVITNDRPRSLSRLLHSLVTARYYGDVVQMRINIDQTADIETRRIAARFHWNFGVVQLQHRIRSAGLMQAVVEAWYPHDNDTYGVLLEDDVEVSPLFYAWIKAAILQYRYGAFRARARNLFGVSLYQPGNLELRVGGRVPFDPRAVFAENQLLDVRTPYLSQVPCSWGAVYFPEHFREFHDYLALRLSEDTHNITETIIPNIRSNRWTRSWKKYFNELVYLRGYVMLYPNYDLSLSTNHLEPGTHAKDSRFSKSVRRQYDVPLMPLPFSSSVHPTPSLLDLPGGLLPAWDDLPVLDLWGTVTSHQEIQRRGHERHKEISGCSSRLAQSTYDASELLCPRPPAPV